MIRTKTDMRVAFEAMPVKPESVQRVLRTQAGIVKHRKRWHVQRTKETNRG